jgi:hypothetical protein
MRKVKIRECPSSFAAGAGWSFYTGAGLVPDVPPVVRAGNSTVRSRVNRRRVTHLSVNWFSGVAGVGNRPGILRPVSRSNVGAGV